MNKNRRVNMTLTMNIDGQPITFRRSLVGWVKDFGKGFVVRFKKPAEGRDKWTAWLQFGVEPVAVSDSLKDAYETAQRLYVSTLRDGDMECRRSRFQPESQNAEIF